jgi:hypothetical protein
MAKAPTNVPSYVHGASEIPLLGETIGRNLDRTVARVPDRDALVSVHQGIRLTTRSSSPPSRRSPAACWRSASSRASGSASGRPTTPSGRSCRTVISIRRPHAQTRQINKSTARQPRRPMPPTKDLRGFGATPDPGGDDVADADDAHELASTTGRWRNPWFSITSRASSHAMSGPAVVGSLVIHAETGEVARSVPEAAARSTSRSVRIPMSQGPCMTTAEPTRACTISLVTSATGRSPDVVRTSGVMTSRSWANVTLPRPQFAS